MVITHYMMISTHSSAASSEKHVKQMVIMHYVIISTHSSVANSEKHVFFNNMIVQIKDKNIWWPGLYRVEASDFGQSCRISVTTFP